MMIPATLALLVTFAVPSPAENGDASFANVLGDIQISTQKLVQDQKAGPKKRRAKAKPAVPQAAPVAPSAPDAVWQKIVEAVKKDGKYKAGNIMMPGSFTLEDVAGDPKADHTKRTITFLGMLNDEEQFEAMGAMIVSMKHTLDSKTGNFNVDMWMFETDVYGEVTDSAHLTGQMTPDGKPAAPPTPDKPAAGDPKIKTAYDAETKFWSEWSPK
ncbi:MAG: hypothetical protein HY923_05915 [Elusimicrobia bacterium]|nr:hypothetical protein [Elusimicrobiota bacterium]